MVCLDLDGTLTDTEHRQHFLTGDKQDWDSFHAACVDDPPNEQVCAIARGLYGGRIIEIWTGRPERYRTETLDWLHRNRIRHHKLRMKPDDEPTIHANELKGRWLAEIRGRGDDVDLAIDDRASCVAWWREQGVTAIDVAGHPY